MKPVSNYISEHPFCFCDRTAVSPVVASRCGFDAGRRRGNSRGRFLVLGSASIDLLKQSSESLAGRIRYLELGPLDAGEVGPRIPAETMRRLWTTSGW